MSEQLPEPPNEGHPIIAGLVALVGVAVVVGLVLGVVALAGTRVVGLGEDNGSGGTSAERSLYVPLPEKTPLRASPSSRWRRTAPRRPAATKEPTRNAAPRKQITLAAAVTTVAPMERIDLTGVYAGGEGAILRVERFADGSWQDFGHHRLGERRDVLDVHPDRRGRRQPVPRGRHRHRARLQRSPGHGRLSGSRLQA